MEEFDINRVKLLLLAFLILTLSSCIGTAAEIRVQPGSSIQAAINSANTGDVVVVEPGTYYENINIKKIDLKNFVLRSASDNPADTIIAANNTGANVITVEYRENITIKGFTISGAGTDRAGVQLLGSRNCIIENNIFSNDALGVYLRTSPYNTVRNNVISRTDGTKLGRGVNVEQSSSATVSGNSISEQRYGVYVSNSNSCSVSENTVSGSATHGMVIDQSNNVVLESNTVNSSADFGIYLTKAHNNILRNNVVSKSNNGINLVESSGNTISNNTADLANHAIFMNLSNGNHLQGNTVSSSIYGLAMRYSNNNKIIENNAYNNVGTGSTGFYFTWTSNGNKISGNKVNKNYNGIVLANGAYNNTLENNELGANSNYGIYVESAPNNKILNNNIFQNSRGIFLLGVASRDNTISANLMDTNYGDGIRLENASNNYINSNYLKSNAGIGVYLVNSNNSYIDSNTALGNYNKGIYVMSSTGDKISNNIIASENSYEGIMLSLADNVTISSNKISKCGQGISLNSSVDNTVLGNTLEWNSGQGLFLCARSGNNLIYNNNFYNVMNADARNARCIWNIARTNGRNIMGGSSLGGNFWAKPDYTGHSQITPDANNDGFADSAYVTENIVDNYPLIDVPDPIIPAAAISANVSSGYAPLTVQFTDLSQGATSWNWDFGYDRSSTSLVQSPVYTYNTPGNYTVKLTATNGNGSTTSTQLINVQKFVILPVADFSTNVTSGDTPLTVQFKDISQNAELRFWDFGDGTNSTVQEPVHTYSTASTYNVVLTVSNVNGTVAKAVPITVQTKSTSSGGSSGGSSHNSGSSSGGSSSSGSSSGGGGGAGGSPEPAKNVKVKELSQVFITSGKPVKFEFSRNATAIVSLNFDSRKTVAKTTTIVEMLKNKSTLTPDAPEGEVYNYLNIWVGNGGYGSDEDNLENAVVNFRVEKSWLQDKGIDQSSIVLNRYDSKKWNELPTTLIREDDKYLYFKAETPGFSPFAITGEATAKEPDTEMQNETEDLEENNGNTESETEQKPADEEKADTSEKEGMSTPGFEMIYGIAGLLTVFLYKRK